MDARCDSANNDCTYESIPCQNILRLQSFTPLLQLLKTIRNIKRYFTKHLLQHSQAQAGLLEIIEKDVCLPKVVIGKTRPMGRYRYGIRGGPIPSQLKDMVWDRIPISHTIPYFSGH